MKRREPTIKLGDFVIITGGSASYVINKEIGVICSISELTVSVSFKSGEDILLIETEIPTVIKIQKSSVDEVKKIELRLVRKKFDEIANCVRLI